VTTNGSINECYPVHQVLPDNDGSSVISGLSVERSTLRYSRQFSTEENAMEFSVVQIKIKKKYLAKKAQEEDEE
jgi:hypothetical protein